MIRRNHDPAGFPGCDGTGDKSESQAIVASFPGLRPPAGGYREGTKGLGRTLDAKTLIMRADGLLDLKR